MIKWILGSLALVVVMSLILLVSFRGEMAKPTRLIGANPVRSWANAGALVYRRLNQDIQEASVLLLGSSLQLESSRQVWAGFLKTLYSESTKTDVVVLEQKGLPPLLRVKGFEYRTFSFENLTPSLQAALKTSKKVVVHSLNHEILKMTKGRLVQKLTERSAPAFLAMAQTHFGVKQKGLNQCEPTQPLCQLNLSAARFQKAYRDKLKTSKNYVGMQRWGKNDYIIFTAE